MNEKRPKTIFCDIDGTLVVHEPPNITSNPDHKMKILSGTINKLLEWDKLKENNIIYMQEDFIIYDLLIMGIGGGERILINDRKLNSDKDYAKAINLERNKGIGDLIV